jgi:hypothetical protein
VEQRDHDGDDAGDGRADQRDDVEDGDEQGDRGRVGHADDQQEAERDDADHDRGHDVAEHVAADPAQDLVAEQADPRPSGPGRDPPGRPLDRRVVGQEVERQDQHGEEVEQGVDRHPCRTDDPVRHLGLEVAVVGRGGDLVNQLEPLVEVAERLVGVAQVLCLCWQPVRELGRLAGDRLSQGESRAGEEQQKTQRDQGN